MKPAWRIFMPACQACSFEAAPLIWTGNARSSQVFAHPRVACAQPPCRSSGNDSKPARPDATTKRMGKRKLRIGCAKGTFQIARVGAGDVQKGRSKLHIEEVFQRSFSLPMCNLGRPFCTSGNRAGAIWDVHAGQERYARGALKPMNEISDLTGLRRMRDN